jgi:fatty-acyl-CoA synthase
VENQGIGTWIDRKLAHVRQKTAIVYRDDRVSYEHLAERVARLAQGLRAQGVRATDRVAYLGNNHPSFLETLFATATLGAIFVPLNTRLAPPEIGYMLRDSGATVLIHRDGMLDLAVSGSEGLDLRRIVVVDTTATLDDPRGTERSDSPVFDYETLVAASPADRVDVPVAQDDPAMILYTSGTTGFPKGAVLTHANITWNSFNVIVDFGVTVEERVLLISPMFHVAALTNGAITALLQGATIVLHERFDPAHVLAAIESERISMLSGVPTTFQMLHEHPAWATTDIGTLRRLTCGGSAVPERTMLAFEDRGLGFSMGYGLTETSPAATMLPAHLSRTKLGSAGWRHFFTDVKIVDETGSEVARGVVGEILVSGPNVIREYWNRPDATAATIVDGWLHSGDLGYIDADGCLFIADRLKDMIISGGENIYSAEVEGVIMELPEIAAVALVGFPDAKWGEVPHAYVQLHPGQTLTAEEVIGHVTSRLAKYKTPKRVFFVDEFSRTASGKIRKAELRTVAQQN